MSRAPVTALAAALACAAAPAATASEGERAFSATVDYAHFQLGDDVAPHGGALGGELEYGLSDSIALRAAAGGGLYYDDGLAYAGHAVVGITYLFDVLKWVPYAKLGAGALVADGDAFDLAVEPLIELGLGVDFLQSREFSWGVQARYETYTTRTRLVTFGARMTWRWGLF